MTQERDKEIAEEAAMEIYDTWADPAYPLDHAPVIARALAPAPVESGKVLREPTPEQWQDFYERVWDSDESNPTLALTKAELQRIGRAMLAAEGKS